MATDPDDPQPILRLRRAAGRSSAAKGAGARSVVPGGEAALGARPPAATPADVTAPEVTAERPAPAPAAGSVEPVGGQTGERRATRVAVGRSASPEATRPPDPMKRALVAAPIVAVLVGIAVVLGNLPTGNALPVVATSEPSASTAGHDPGYLVSRDELLRRRDLAERGEEPYASAAADLIEWADEAIRERARPVHPLVVEGTENALVQDARRAYGMGLAYTLTGDERYAASSRETIRAWVDTSVATADTCPDSGGCHTSLILGRVGPGFAFGADLIDSSEAWTDDDTDDLKTWLRDVLLPAASERPNNWGDAGTFLRAVAADYAGDEAAFSAAIDKWRSLIDLIEADGRIPEEVRRGKSGIMYTQEALQYKVAVAAIAERRGINLWDYVGAEGGSLKAALDRLAYYWHRPDEWPDYDGPTVPSPGPVWEIAYAHWRDSDWVEIMLDARPYGDRGHSAIRWTTLTNGIPVDPLVAAGPSGSPDPSAAASGPPSPSEPTPSATPTRTPRRPAAVPPITGLAVRLGAAVGDPAAVTIRWDPPTIDGAGVEVERLVGDADWAPIPIAASGNAATDTVAPGQPRAYRVRAVVDGAAGLWSQVDQVSVSRLEMTSGTAQLSGSWSRVSFGPYSGGAATSTDDAGARIVWQGTAAGLAVIGPTGATRGAMNVTSDGGTERIDLGREDYTPRTLLFSTNWSSPAEREVAIEAVAVSGRRTVAVDDIVVLTYRLSPLPPS